MNKDKFIELIIDYQQYDNSLEYYKDIINTDNPLFDFGFQMFNMYLELFFNQEQIDWVTWWFYERMPGCTIKDRFGLEVEIDTPEKLWDLIQEYNDISSK